MMMTCYTCDNKNCDKESPFVGCNHIVASKDELVRRLLICSGKDDDPSSEVSDISNVLSAVYGYTDEELYRDSIERILCPKCNGTAVLFKGDDMADCDCKTGLITNPALQHMRAFFYMHIPGSGLTVSTTSYNKIKRINQSYNKLSVHLNIHKTYISENIAVDEFTNNDKFIVIQDCCTNEIPRIVAKGTYEEIHDELNIPIYQDIEYVTSGKYVVFDENSFYSRYELIEKNSIDQLRVSHLETMTLMYIQTCCSYGDSAFGLLDKYFARYQTLADVQDNIIKSIPELTQATVALDDMVNIINKICDEFRIIGIHVTKSDAASIIKQIETMLGENSMEALTNEFIPAVFLVEYILISKEYSNLMNDDE